MVKTLIALRHMCVKDFGVEFREMKKLLGILVLGLMLSGNAYAGWFSKLPILKCEIWHDGKSYGTKFYNLRDDFNMVGSPEAPGSWQNSK